MALQQARRAFKVCHVFPFFSIRYFGGTCDWMYKLTKAQVKAGMFPEILTGTYRFDDELAKSLAGVKITVCRSYLDKAGFSLMPGLFRFARRAVQSYDVVHMHVFRSFQNAILYFYCRHFGIPYIVDAHGAVPYHRRKPIIKRLFDLLIGRRMLEHAKLVVAETAVGVQEYKAILPTLDGSKIVTLPAPFDTDEFADLPARGLFRARFGIPEDAKLVMFLGRVHPLKGNDFLINAIAEARRQRPDVWLAIVGGDDGHMEACKQVAADLGIASYVIFTGFLGGKDKLAALVDADIVAQMSRVEQGAWAPIEGVLSGTPIVVSAHTGAGEDVRRLDAGYTAEFGNVPDLAGRLCWIIDHYADAKAKTMRARDLIQREHSMTARISDFATLYARCIAAPPRDVGREQSA